MIKFPNLPLWFEVEHDGQPVYTCFDSRDALRVVQTLISDQIFINCFAVSEFAVRCFFQQKPLFAFVWDTASFNDPFIDYDSAKVYKFFDDVEVESYGGPEES